MCATPKVDSDFTHPRLPGQTLPVLTVTLRAARAANTSPSRVCPIHWCHPSRHIALPNIAASPGSLRGTETPNPRQSLSTPDRASSIQLLRRVLPALKHLSYSVERRVIHTDEACLRVALGDSAIHPAPHTAVAQVAIGDAPALLQPGQRFVRPSERSRISAGVLAGIDLSLVVIGELAGAPAPAGSQ
jgi:hypothetical protein